MYNNILDLNQMKMMSFEQKIEAFRNGYRLADMSNIGNYDLINRYNSIAALASCPTQVVQNSTKPIRVSVTTPGTLPYHFHVLKDDNPLYTYDGGPTETIHEFSHKFSDPIGETHNYKVYVADNCGIGSLSSNTDSCTINIVSLQPGNLVLNPDFQIFTTPGIPDNWYTYQTGKAAIFTYPNTGRPGGSSKSVSIEYATLEPGQFAQIGQNIGAIIPGNYYLLTGWMMTQNVVGEVGVTIQANWNDSTDKYLSSSFINAVVGTIPWTQYTGVVQAPSNASKGFVVLQIYQSSGKAYFTDMSFMVTTAPVCTTPVVTMTI